MFAYVTPTVSVTLPECGCSWEPLPNPRVDVSTPSSNFVISQGRMNRGSRIRHPVWFIWRREITVDSASSREGTLAMPPRESRVFGWGGEGRRGGGEEGGEGSVCQEHTAFTHLENCENVPFTPSAARPSCGAVLVSMKCPRVGGVGLTRPQRANLCPTVTPDPDPVTRGPGRNRAQVWVEIQLCGRNLTKSGKKQTWKMTKKTAIYLCNKRKYLFGIRIASTN